MKDIDLEISDKHFIAVLGASGSGKSTLMQHFNHILEPTEGRIKILDFQMSAGKKIKNKNELRKRVGLLFQFPEQQLFAETLLEDLCFGPINFGATEEEAKESAIHTIESLGLDPSILERNPYHLSGGQIRKAAIASVLIMNPDIYVLDEPTASLDQKSREEVMKLLSSLSKNGKSVVVVTHRMEEVLPYADHYVVMSAGKVIFQGGAEQLIDNSKVLDQAGIVLPSSVQFIKHFNERFNVKLKYTHQADELVKYVSELITS